MVDTGYGDVVIIDYWLMIIGGIWGDSIIELFDY